MSKPLDKKWEKTHVVVGGETTDDNLADQYEFEHRKLHNYWEGWEGFNRSDENEES